MSSIKHAFVKFIFLTIYHIISQLSVIQIFHHDRLSFPCHGKNQKISIVKIIKINLTCLCLPVHRTSLLYFPKFTVRRWKGKHKRSLHYIPLIIDQWIRSILSRQFARSKDIGDLQRKSTCTLPYIHAFTI